MHPLLSVISPFAGGAALQRFLASLCMQSFPPDRLELIIVTDFSPDIEPQVASAYLTCATQIIRWNRPRDFIGHSAGILRNLGVSAACGDVFVFLDADVMLHVDCLAHHASYHQNDACLALAGAAHELSIDNQSSSDAEFPSFAEALRRSVPDYRLREHPSAEPPWAQWFSLNASVSRRVFEATGGFSERGYRCHDLELAYRLFKGGVKFIFSPEAEVIHLEHPRSLRVRADQIHGWIDIGRQHSEIQPYVEDRIRVARRSLHSIASEAEARFLDLTAGLSGYRIECSWICPKGSQRSEIDRRLTYCSHTVTDRPDGTRLQLRLHKNCWDYSIDLLAPESVQAPRASVVCPIYNSRKTLSRAVRSVLMQSLLAWELILVDDASEEGSVQLASQYLCDPRVRLVSHRYNKGLSHSLNSGLALARSPVLVQLDSDDTLEPDALTRILEIFSQEPETLAIYGDPWVHESAGRVRTYLGRQLRHAEDYFEYREYQVPRAYRTEALKAIGGWLTNDAYEGRIYDDRLILARLADIGMVRWIPQKLYHVYERAESLSRSDTVTFAAGKYAILCDQANRRGRRFRRLNSHGHLRGVLDPRSSISPSRSWSVIIPFRRSQEHLFLSLRSWLESDLLATDGEILVVGPITPQPLGQDFDVFRERVRFLGSVSVEPPGRSRNQGARLAHGEMLFFSDEDHVVPPDVIACHERAHAELGRPGVVVGNVFGRRGAVSIVPEDRPEHKRRILEGLRWSAEFPEIAARVATGQRASLSLSDGPGVWEYVGRAAFTEIWMRRWAEILVRFGENLEAYPHRWTRLTAGSLSMPAAFFRDLGGFAEDIEAMEDWEMGARLQRRGGAIACAPEAEPYHLIHPVDQDRRGRDLQSYTVLKKVHPDLLAAVMSDTSKQASPARDTFCHFEEILATQVPTESASSSDSSISRLCSLTFDDGPHPLGTPTVLQILSSYDVKATFFCVGQSAAKYSELVKAIAAEGHELGIHGWTHTSVDAMTDEELKLDIQRTRETLESLSGKPVRFIRPTYGRATAGFLAISRELGLEVVNWHTSTEDWLALRPEDIIFNLAWQGVINKVILFHDGSGDPDVTRQALQWLLAACQRWNCSVTPLENLIRSFPVPSLRPLSIERWTDFAEW